MPIFPKRPIELMAIANDHCLLPRLFIQYALDLTFVVAGENVRTHADPLDAFNRRRTKHVYIDPDGQITHMGNPHIQKARIGFIDSDGNSHRWGSDFSEQMYLRFINIKSERALDRFVQKTGFCVFPSTSETEALFKEYGERKIEPPRVFLPGREADSELNRDKMEILRINMRFIAKKRDELRRMVEQYEDGSFRYNQLLWLNRQMENISDILIDGNHFIWDEIKRSAKGKTANDTRGMETVLGSEAITGKKIVPALRAYGHYAYCCYEFFLDVLMKNDVSVCKHCERIFKPQRKGQMYCKEPGCVSERKIRYRTSL